MTTQEIAARLAELCRNGEFETAYKELFSEDACSIEPEAMGGFEKETKGLDAMFKKAEQFGQMVEAIHGIEVSEPLVAGNSIALKLTLDSTMKGRERQTMTEICLYKVKDGKIISEEFFM
ncbi:MAG TPA: nuclear transport factor 2 family protein [Chitinophagaceae bacterium]|nr:nuclear transport factor 2 family protein [Chitinophagaceae bacterium]